MEARGPKLSSRRLVLRLTPGMPWDCCTQMIAAVKQVAVQMTLPLTPT